MTRATFTLSFIVAAAVTAAGVTAAIHAQRNTEPVTAFTNVTVVDVRTGRLAPASSIIVRGDRIVTVDAVARVKVPDGATTVDGAGAYVIPGLWDMHVHTFNNGQAAGTDNHLPYFALQIANGVTGVRDMWTDPDDLRLAREWRKATDAGRMVSPRLLGTSPILDGAPRIWPNSIEITSAAQAREVVDALAADGVEALKVYTRLSREAYMAITERAKAHRLAVVGHPPSALHVSEIAAAGQKSIEHLQGTPEECSSASEEMKQAADGRERQRMMMETYDSKRCGQIFELFVRNGTWQVPTLVLHRGRLLAFDPAWERARGMDYVSKGDRDAWSAAHKQAAQRVDADKALGPFRRALVAYMLRLTGSMDRAGVGLLAGTDLGNPFVIAGFSLHEELALFVEAGLSPLQALRTATINPARYQDATDRFGTVEAGKDADFVLLHANPLADIRNTTTVRAVVTNGRHLDRRALDALLATAFDSSAVK